MAGHLTASLLVAMMLLHTVNSQEPLIQESCPDPANGTVGPDLLEYLIHPCRYDRWAMPRRDNDSEPFEVSVRMHIYFLGPIEASDLQLTTNILLRLRWHDYRLRFEDFAPEVLQLVREGSPRNELWTPHLYIVNEQNTEVMGADRQDIMLTVEPDGTVMLSTRLKMTVFCIMNLQRFPFDRQKCPLFLESWTYNADELQVVWESENPVTVSRDLHLTEYRLVNLHSNFTIANYSMRREQSTSFSLNSRVYGKFGGNYSSLTLRFDLAREVGYHIMDYYVPSILIVAVSWVTFFLDPNAYHGRTTLGTSTMLTFITLSRNIGSSLPKVSYIKSTEIWFVVCTVFIFGALIEFAISNSIWRRKNNVEMKSLNCFYMIKAACTTQPSRRRLILSGRTQDQNQSMPSVAQAGSLGTNTTLDDNTMSPKEIAEWLDRRSRVWFPVMFLIFNILYWVFVLI